MSDQPQDMTALMALAIRMSAEEESERHPRPVIEKRRGQVCLEGQENIDMKKNTTQNISNITEIPTDSLMDKIMEPDSFKIAWEEIQ